MKRVYLLLEVWIFDLVCVWITFEPLNMKFHNPKIKNIFFYPLLILDGFYLQLWKHRLLFIFMFSDHWFIQGLLNLRSQKVTDVRQTCLIWTYMNTFPQIVRWQQRRQLSLPWQLWLWQPSSSWRCSWDTGWWKVNTLKHLLW